MNRIFRCRLQNASGFRLTYIGPYESIPAGWSMVMRRIVISRKAS